MGGKSVGLKILWWSEVIVSARVLLFFIPVVINTYMAGTLSLSDPAGRFTAVTGLTALVYAAVGIVSLAGYRFWKTVHYLAVTFVFLATAAFFYWPGRAAAAAGAHYLLPLLFSVLMTMLAVGLGVPKQQTA